jgi:hypothetical protein
MQVHKIVTAAVLAVAAAGAMAQEIDPGETLQARSLAARQAQVESSQARTRESLAAQARKEQASRQIKAGELAQALPVDAAPNIAWAKWHVTRPYGRSWLHGDRRQPRDLVIAARR